MKHSYIFLSLLLLISLAAEAQYIQVSSFQKLEYDLTARMEEPLNDLNGRKCAVVKIVTTQTGFSFENGALGIVKVVYKPAEIWVYVPQGTAKLKISHPVFGQTKTETGDGFYWFEIGNLQAATCYRMEIVCRGMETPIGKPVLGKQTDTPAADTIKYILDKGYTCTANGVTFEMVFVEGGDFLMGATDEMKHQAMKDEIPVHRVTLSNFCIGKYEVTQELWDAVMGFSISNKKGKNLPAESVSWEECQTFLQVLNTICHKNGSIPTYLNFCLPTEAQWEYAARGGKFSKGYRYSGGNNIKDVAWYKKNSKDSPHPVGTKLPNELGLYDMSGNIAEWCQDYYNASYYSGSPSTDPQGAIRGANRVVRGFAYSVDEKLCRVSQRGSLPPAGKYFDIGFRLVLK